MGSKEEFTEAIDADESIPVGKPGALSAVEALATRDWYDRERFAAGRGVHGVPEVRARPDAPVYSDHDQDGLNLLYGNLRQARSMERGIQKRIQSIEEAIAEIKAKY